MRKLAGSLMALLAGAAPAEALTPEQAELVTGCQTYAKRVYSVSHFGAPSITQELNSTYAAFKAGDMAVVCEYLTNSETGHKLFHNISADGVPRVRLVLGDDASVGAITTQFADYYSAQGLATDQIQQLAREWRASLQVRHFQTQ
jgi:hypothetical protein